jgi:CheY-like chemotaxis protein
MRLDGCKVLVVDDSTDNQKIFSRFLNMAGAAVEIAGNGDEAVRRVFELLVSSGVDVVVMDIHMPVLDGLSASRLLRDVGFNGPIIALTADDRIVESERFAASGYSHFQSKPIDRRGLTTVVRSAWMEWMLSGSSIFRQEGAS